MKPYKPPARAVTHASYAACRHGGSPPQIVAVQLDLPREAAERLERLFRAQPGRAGDAMKPRFARHAAHVGAVLRAGGYPAIGERPETLCNIASSQACRSLISGAARSRRTVRRAAGFWPTISASMA